MTAGMGYHVPRTVETVSSYLKHTEPKYEAWETRDRYQHAPIAISLKEQPIMEPSDDTEQSLGRFIARRATEPKLAPPTVLDLDYRGIRDQDKLREDKRAVRHELLLILGDSLRHANKA